MTNLPVFFRRLFSSPEQPSPRPVRHTHVWDTASETGWGYYGSKVIVIGCSGCAMTKMFSAVADLEMPWEEMRSLLSVRTGV